MKGEGRRGERERVGGGGVKGERGGRVVAFGHVHCTLVWLSL